MPLGKNRNGRSLSILAANANFYTLTHLFNIFIW